MSDFQLSVTGQSRCWSFDERANGYGTRRGELPFWLGSETVG